MTAVGAWGDTFCSFGTIRHLVETMGLGNVGIVHYGFDPHISAFLSHQKGVAAVHHVRPENEAAYRYWLHHLSMPTCPFSEYADELLRGTGLSMAEVLRTHVYGLDYKQTVHHWYDPVLPARSTAWAKSFAERVCEGKPFILLHPFSTQSSSLDGHWPYWKAAIEWLMSAAADFALKVLWTGAVNPLDIRHPSLINAVGVTPSMMEVFALQRQAALTVATSNGVAHWAVMDRTPAVICCNNHMIPGVPLPGVGHIFKEWISTEPVVQVEYRDRLDVFQRRVCDALSQAATA